jgi:CRP-like cAMP-binding protein
MTTMYDTLLQLPLFQGICKEDLTQILGKVKLHFLKYEAKSNIVRGGDVCSKLIFLLSGEVLSTHSFKKDFVFMEHVPTPYLIEPYSLFGIDIHYTASYIAHTNVDVLEIEKSFVVNELLNYEIFRFNYINIISNRAQTLHTRLQQNIPDTAEKKIIYFISLHSTFPGGKKRLRIKMNDLAQHLNETRLNISKALNSFEEKGWVELHRKEIIIPAMEHFFMD